MKNSKKPAWKKSEQNLSFRPLEIKVRDNDVESALKILRSKMSKDGVLSELKKRRSYEKPSDKKRREKREAIKKIRRARNKRLKVRQQRRRKTNGR